MWVKIGRRNVDLVALLKAELERHQRPKALKRPGRFKVCTDIDDFELCDTFDALMSARIFQSGKFMLVCSPHCAASPFVGQEMSLFGRLKAGEKPLVTSSKRSASIRRDTLGNFDPNRLVARYRHGRRQSEFPHSLHVICASRLWASA